MNISVIKKGLIEELKGYISTQTFSLEFVDTAVKKFKDKTLTEIYSIMLKEQLELIKIFEKELEEK